jgi:hypothetical protein
MTSEQRSRLGHLDEEQVRPVAPSLELNRAWPCDLSGVVHVQLDVARRSSARDRTLDREEVPVRVVVGDQQLEEWEEGGWG